MFQAANVKTDRKMSYDKPLLNLLGDRSLENLSNTRLRKLKEKTLRYRFKMEHIPGVKHPADDGLSRYPTHHNDSITTPAHDDPLDVDPSDMPYLSVSFLADIRDIEPSDSIETCIVAHTEASLSNITAVTWNKVPMATASDDTMNALRDVIESGIAESRNDLPIPLQDYHQFRSDLHTTDGIIMYKGRIVVPPYTSGEVLTALHGAHQGVSSMIKKAKASVFWPGITSDFNNIRNTCQACNRMTPSQPSAPPTPMVPPVYPFQCICADYFHHKHRNYMVIVDLYTNWLIVERSSDGAQGFICALRKQFSTFGIAQELASDGGPEFTANSTQKFLSSWSVHQRLSSVAFPHSNCRA